MASVAQQAPEVKAAREFLNRLFGDANEGYLVVFSLPEKSTVSFDLKKTNAIDEAVQKAFELCEKGQNAYFCLSAQGKAEVRKNENAIGIPGVWAELDVKGGGFKSTEQAMEFIDEVCAKELKLQPTILVSSGGGGFHAYWLFKEFWMFDGKAEQQKGAALVGRFQQLLRQKAREWGAALDSTADLSRVYRVPGTKNFKYDEPREVRVRQVVEGALYTPDTIEAVVEEHLVDDGVVGDWKPSAWPERNLPDAKVEPILEGCAFIRHCRDDAATLSEPDWYKMLNILSYCENGQKLAHEWSAPYPGYSAEETAEKMEHAGRDSKPFTCRKIAEDTGKKFCSNCEHFGLIGSPIALGMPSEADLLMERIKNADSLEDGAILLFENIAVFARLKSKDPGKFEAKTLELRKILGKALNMNSFTKAVNITVEKLKEAKPEGKVEDLADYLPDVPVEGLKKPHGYAVTDTGVKAIKADGRIKHISATPIIISRRLKNVDTGDEKLELMYRRDGGWHNVLAERVEIFNTNKVVDTLGRKGATVHSRNAPDVVQYLADFEEANLHMRPARSVAHLGWVDDNLDAFLPGMPGDVVLEPIDTKGYEAKGDLETWKRNMRPVLERPIPRFVLAASFASPLLRLIGSRVFLVYIWGPTRGGKTASLQAAASVWGNPKDVIESFNDTGNYLGKRASLLSDLPLIIDERQAAGDKQKFLDQLVYMLGLGRSRGRATKDGGLQETSRWYSLALTTGEESLSSDNSAGGVKSRSLEVYGVPFKDEEAAASIYRACRAAYGVAGPEFIRHVMEADHDALRAAYDRLGKVLKEQHPDNIDSHINAVAAVLVGDMYSQHWIWGVPLEEAEKGALEIGAKILGTLETKHDIDDAARAYEQLMDWIKTNRVHFNGMHEKPYGFMAAGRDMVCFYGRSFNEALKELGFNPKRMKQEWRERGWLLPGSEPGRFTSKQWNPSRRKYERVIAVKMQPEEEGEEEEEELLS